MGFGVLLGVATVVTTVSLADTAELQVSGTFDALRATKVDVEVAETESAAGPEADTPDEDANPAFPKRILESAFPADAAERVLSLNGVQAAGVYQERRAGTTRITGSALPQSSVKVEPRVVGVGIGVLDAADVELRGSPIGLWQMEHHTHVVLVGRVMAAQLGIESSDTSRYVYIDDVPFLVLGVIDNGGRLPQLEASVVIPATTHIDLWGVGDERMLIQVESSAGPAVAAAVPLALDPGNPDRFHSLDPTDPKALRQVVQSDLATLGLWLAIVATLAGMVGIGSSTFGAIYERMAEFGLRRALGGRAGHLRRHVLTECSAVGLLAGIAGAYLGLAILVIFSNLRGWAPVLDPWVLLGAPLLGLGSGLGAGIIPAWKAGRVEPAESLRR
jgi:putative ABC transport system permease protein